MILIAHRGNISGPIPEKENSPAYIMAAIRQGYGVEIDVWWHENNWFLGHDEPQYETDLEFLSNDGLWIHCKNYEALQKLVSEGSDLNFFFHTKEDYVLTSQQNIWAFPGIAGDENTICVLPEYHDTPTDGCAGICSNYIERYSER